MNRNIRYRVAFIVIGMAVLTFIACFIVVIPIIRWQWEFVIGRIWFVGLLVIIALFLGMLRIMIRLRPIEEFRLHLLKGEPIGKDLFQRTEHITLLFPISSAVIAPVFMLAGAMGLAVDMSRTFHAPVSQIAMMLLSVVLMTWFLAIFCFYLVKQTLEPVVERLMFEDPNFIDIRPPIRLQIRTKLIISFASLGIVAALFALLGNTSITDTVKKKVTDPVAAQDILGRTHQVLVWELLASLATAILMGLLAANDLARPLKKISEAAKDISRGEGKQRIPIMTEDEVGDLAKTINYMNFGLLENLTDALRKAETLLSALREAVDVLHNNSWELSTIASEQFDSAIRQTTSTQQASATSMEISDSARLISASARKVYELAEDARKSCDDGDQTLKSTLEDIRTAREHAESASEVIVKMRERSQEIKAVVDIIEEISSQINLLSVNAALEAVGAGAAGRRFRTVAQEVGRLAEKTSEAIERVRKIITEAGEYTEEAVSVVQKSAEVAIAGAEKTILLDKSFGLIRNTVSGTVEASREIELVTGQQVTASDQMVEAITGIADNSRQLEEMSQRLQKSAENLATLTDRLKEMTAGGIGKG